MVENKNRSKLIITHFPASFFLPESGCGRVVQGPKTDIGIPKEICHRSLQGRCCGTILLHPPFCHKCRCDGQSLRSHFVIIRKKDKQRNKTHRVLHPNHGALYWRWQPLASGLLFRMKRISTVISSLLLVATKHSN